MLADPHFQARQSIIDLPHPRFGSLKMQNAFPHLSRSPSSVRRAAPQVVGEHNAEVYGELLGLDAATLADLAGRQVI